MECIYGLDTCISSNPKTASLLEFCGAYPNQLRNILQQDDSQKIANTFAKIKKIDTGGKSMPYFREHPRGGAVNSKERWRNASAFAWF